MKTVLSSTRHYELIPSTTLKAAHESLHGELGPAIEELLHRVEAEVGAGGRLERREEGLKARYGLLEGRMGEDVRGGDDGDEDGGGEEAEEEEGFGRAASRRKSLIGGDDMETKSVSLRLSVSEYANTLQIANTTAEEGTIGLCC